MTINEQGLRRRIGSENLIGCYTVNESGMTYFTDIRGGEGDVVKNPLDEKAELKVSYSGPSLTPGMFYSFLWKLDESSTKIIVNGKPEPIENSAFLQGLFDARLKLSGSNLELFNNFQKTIFNEVTGAQHTYIYELLQNANDYPHNKEHVEVKFILTEHYLFFMHSGACFNLRNVVGISSINQGEKQKNTETIGYKGIGFKTVFVNNDYVYLKSGDWSLRFDKSFSENAFAGECPWALMPIPTEIKELDSEVLDTLSANDMRVQFALRHKTDASKNIEQLDKVFSDNQILLFIPNVYKVDVIQGGKICHSVEKDDKKWVVTDYRYPVPENLRAWVDDNINSGDKIPEKFKDIKNVRISFAVGRDGKVIIPVDNARVYNYLPTELRLGFKFLFNADFVPNGSRSGLHDVVWNDSIMEQCGCQFADWWVSFLQNEGEYDLSSVFELLPDFNNRDHYAGLFLKGFSHRIKQIPCIPTLRDGYHLVKLEDVLFDKIDFIACDEPVLSDEELYEFSDTTGALPHPSIRNNDNLKNLLKHFNLSIEFNNNQLTQLCFEEDFKQWLKDKANNLSFIGYLLRCDYIMNYWGYKIFLKEDGALDKADSIYYNIDQYIDDISFLANDLPRLNIEIRDELASRFKTWAGYSTRFKKFNEYEFTRLIFDDFSRYVKLFSVQKNSVNYIHFLAITSSIHQIPSDYPYFDQDRNKVNGVSDLYQLNETGKDIAGRSWIKKEWIKFLHPDYLERDEEKVKGYLESKCKIKPLSQSDCYRIFISREDRVPSIAESIKSEEANLDFYCYLSKIQDSISNLSPLMRQSYVVRTTDGRSEQWSLISKTIFWKDNDWENMSGNSWMPDGCCLAISDMYFDNISGYESDRLREFFSLKQVVQRYSVAGLYQSLRSHLSEVFSQITTKEISKAFLNWIFLNRTQIFKDGNIDSQFRSIPIQCKDSDELRTIESLGGSIYLPNEESLELYNQPWFNSSDLIICDDFYKDLFDGSERCNFFVSLGMKQFEKLHYLRAHLLRHLDRVKENLSNRDNNLSFHRYLADVHDGLSEKDLEVVKGMPIFISSPNDAEGVLVETSDNHYLPSELLTDIISKDLVPLSILDSIHPDYITSDKDKKYFTDKLGNVEIDEDGFFDYIIKDGTAPEVKPYLESRERNIRFWRWIADSKAGREKKAKLSIFPLLGNMVDEEADHLETPSSLYISGKYTKAEGLEQFITDHISKPVFVSDAYLEEGVERDWYSLFKALKVTVDFKEIVFNNVLPNLSKYKTLSIVGILSKYTDTLSTKLEDKDSDISKYLNQLQLLCNDGIYRVPGQTVVSGQYFDVDLNLFPDIEIGNLVSEEYLSECGEDLSKRREIIKFITLIADHFCQKCESPTQLRNTKLEYYAAHQDLYKDSDAHYRIIGQLADSFVNDPEGIRDILDSMGSIKVYTTNGKFASRGLYLSTIYNPDCQYMANGITELDFVSEKYAEYSPNMKSLFRCLNIWGYFDSRNLPLLKNEQFAVYFWEHYATKRQLELDTILTEDNLRTIICIPTASGMKRPCDVYDYRNSQLQKIVLKLENGNDKLPSVTIPDWLDKIGFRPRLYLPDCLEYLSKDIIDFRREVIKWIADTKEETLHKFKKEITEYSNNANWLNGAKHWVPLRGLVALEWENKTLKDNFGGNPYVCHPSYMPETQQDYNKICDLFGIKILTNKDFTKKKEGNCRYDREAVSEISKRLLYLAYKTGKENWHDIFDGYKEKLDKADISTCERISYSYNDNINKNLRIYAEEQDKLWYLGSWKGPMFLAVLEWIKEKLEVKGDFDINYLSDLFLNSFNEFIRSEEGGTLPQEIIDCIEESERVGIGADELAKAESFNEDLRDENSLSEEHKQAAAAQRQNRLAADFPSQNEAENEEEDDDEEDGVAIEDDSDSSEAVALSERDQSGSRTASDSRTSRSSSQNTSRRSSSKDDEISQDATETSQKAGDKESLQDRLRKKWQNQENAPVAKPHPNKSRQSSEDVFKQDESPTAKNKEDFFDENVNEERRNNTQSSNGRDTGNFSDKYKAAQEEVDKIKDQESLEQLFASTPKYTFLWFKYLMEMLYNEKNDTATNRSVQIDFKSAKLLDQYTVAVIGPNRVVPNWIEHADYIELHILNGTTSHKLDVELQYFTEDGIWVYTNDAQNIEKEINSADKIRMVASGRIANHIDSLTKQFIKLGFEDDYNLKDNLPNTVKYIYGPPGTGKTTRLVESIEDILTSSEVNLDILVLTPTNKAADVIATRLSDNDVCYPSTYRYGITDSLEFLKGNNVFTRNDNFIGSDGHHIVVTTAARYAYDYMMPDEEIICDHQWDYIIIDEASMIDIVTMAFILHKGYDSQFIISGDPKQIQPVRQNEIQPENIYQMVGLNSFAAAQHIPNVEALDKQYRSIPSIGKLVSEYSYDGKVAAYREEDDRRPLDIGMKISSINFVGFQTEQLDNLYGLDAIADSAFHLYSAIFAYEYANYIADKIEEQYSDSPYSIGIVCPYKKQADTIRQMIELRDISNDMCKVTCGTVHSFQGDECDIMIVVLNPPMNVGQNSHVNNQNIINVAMSRARDYIFFLVPDDRTPGFYTREQLGKLAYNKSILYCHDIEEMLFHDREFIKHNTNVSCHTPVNVYYDSTSLYEVRKDDSAVDIQINEQFRK